MRYKQLAPLFSAFGVIVFFVWGVLGNGWGKSWIALPIGGVLSGMCYKLAAQEEGNDSDDKKDDQ